MLTSELITIVRQNVAAQVAEELKTVTYATLPMEERKKERKQKDGEGSIPGWGGDFSPQILCGTEFWTGCGGGGFLRVLRFAHPSLRHSPALSKVSFVQLQQDKCTSVL